MKRLLLIGFPFLYIVGCVSSTGLHTEIYRKVQKSVEVDSAYINTSVYKVVFDKVAMRDGPGTDNEIIINLYADDKVIVHSSRKDWFLVEYFGDIGHVHSSALTQEPSSHPSYWIGWDSANLATGERPICYEKPDVNLSRLNVSRLSGYRTEHINELTGITLKIITPMEFEVIVQLIDKKWDSIIDVVYINNNDSYKFVNIPEGFYYLKIAYGRDLVTKSFDNGCELIFKTNPLYEITGDIELKITQRINDFQPYVSVHPKNIPVFVYEIKPGKINNSMPNINNDKIKSDFVGYKQFFN